MKTPKQTDREPKGDEDNITQLPKKAKAPVLVKVTLRSVQPMLQHRMTDEALDGLPGGSGKLEQPNVKEMTYQQRADLVRYHGPDGEFGIPSECLFGAIVAAGAFVTFAKRKNMSNKEESLVPSFLKILDEFLPFKNQDPKFWTVDKRRGVNPSTGGAMCIIRPRFPNWEIDFMVEIDPATGVKLEQVRDLFNKAGYFSGIGSHRKKGSFGRFRVAAWEVTEAEVRKAA